MNIKKPFFFGTIAGVVTITSAFSASHQSIPVGFIKTTLQQGQTAAVTNPFQDNQTLMSGAMRGTITAAGSDHIENSNANWISGELSQITVPFLIRITTGSAKGHLLTASTSITNTSTRLYVTPALGGPLALGVSAGDSYEIIAADTFSTLFPPGTLQGGTADTADLVRYWNGTGNITYFHNGTNWMRQGAGNSNNVILPPNRGMLILRRGATKTVYFTGTLPPVEPVAVAIAPGQSHISVISAPMTLSQASIQNFFPNWQADITSGYRDYVSVWNGTNYDDYYYNGAAASWVTSSGNNADNTLLYTIERPFFLTRIAAPVIYFTVPSPYLPH